MKVNKVILTTVLVISVSLGLMVGCTSSKTGVDEKKYTVQEVSKIKKDFSNKISKAIEDSGLRVAEVSPDGSFVLSLGNLEYSKDQPKQVLNYSITTDDKENKEVLDIQCVKEYSYDEKLIEDDKFVKAIYNIFKSLTNAQLTEKEFVNEVEKIFNQGEGNIEILNMDGIRILVNKIDESTKTLELRLNDEFILK